MTQPPQPASLPRIEIEPPELAFQRIDPKKHPAYPKHFAITVGALKLHMAALVVHKRAAADALAREVGARKTESARADAADLRASRASWWAQWGVWVGVGGTIVVEALALLLLVAVR
jgi:hypothetical protein